MGFTSIWGINGSYPYLQVFGTPEQPAKQESREVTSYLNIITSQLDVAIDDYVPPKIETRSIQSDIQPISSHIQSHRATLRSIEGYLSRIDTNATQSSHIVRVGNVTSFVSPIQSSVNVSTYRQPIIQTINLVSYLNRIQADTDVLLPSSSKTINGYITIESNQSRTSYNVNNTYSQVIENPSYSEVME